MTVIFQLIHRWLYALILALDANFKLKCKDRGIKDVELAPGWAYFVEQQRYLAHVQTHVDEPEVSSSSSCRHSCSH